MSRKGFLGSRYTPDLEARIINLETKIGSVPTAASAAPGEIIPAGPDLIPAPIGIRFVSNVPGTVTLAWNSVSGSILRYEIYVSVDRTFAHPDIFTVSGKETSYVFSGDPQKNYFIRVRAIASTGRKGLFSSTLDTKVGSVIPSLIVPRAASSFLDLDYHPFTPLLIPYDTAYKVVPVFDNFIELLDRTTLLIVGQLQTLFRFQVPFSETLQITIDGDPVFEFMEHIPVLLECRGQGDVPFVCAFAPGYAGTTHNIGLQIVVEFDPVYVGYPTDRAFLEITRARMKLLQLLA